VDALVGDRRRQLRELLGEVDVIDEATAGQTVSPHGLSAALKHPAIRGMVSQV
jgi:hypothetical protein